MNNTNCNNTHVNTLIISFVLMVKPEGVIVYIY